MYGKSSNKRPGFYQILNIFERAFIGGRRLKQGGIYTIFSGEEIL